MENSGGGGTKKPGVKAAISPRARRLAAGQELDPTQLRGSGTTGRVRERDVAAAIAAGQGPALRGTTPLTAIRKAIAARMVASCQSTAPVTLTAIVDASNIVRMRERFKMSAAEPMPSYTDLVVKLSAAALQKHPLLASRWTDAGIRLAERFNISFAVDTDSGLLVPVIRDVPSLSVNQVAARARELIDLARTGRLQTRDRDGGCFTITNLGAFGIDAFTPIINVPECAILGIGRIEKRPVMEGDRVVGRDMVTLSLTFDHRIVDGAPAAWFLQTLAQMIAEPAQWISGSVSREPQARVEKLP